MFPFPDSATVLLFCPRFALGGLFLDDNLTSQFLAFKLFAYAIPVVDGAAFPVKSRDPPLVF